MTPTPPKRPSISRQGLASELVQDILKTKSEEKKQQQRARGDDQRRRGRLRKLNYFLLFPVFVALAAWNMLRPTKPPVVFTREELDAGVRFKIYLAVQALRVYRDSAGSWPATLDAVGFADEGLVYQRVDTAFQIEAARAGVTFTYRYGDSLAYFRDAAQTLVR